MIVFVCKIIQRTHRFGGCNRSNWDGLSFSDVSFWYDGRNAYRLMELRSDVATPRSLRTIVISPMVKYGFNRNFLENSFHLELQIV